MSDNKIKFYLDNKEVEANQDETIWQVANRLGNEIPHLCYANKPGYRADGNCRAAWLKLREKEYWQLHVLENLQTI